MEKENLSVVIVDYNSVAKTLSYIINLHHHIRMYFDVHYVIVENYEKSLNDSELAVCGWRWSIREENIRNYQKIYSSYCSGVGVDILWSGINNGFAVGNNIGTLYCKKYFHPSLILYSNNDITFQTGFTINSMAQILKEDYKVAAVGPCVVGLEGDRQGPAKKIGYIWGLLLHDFIPEKYRKEIELIEEPKKGYVYWVSGCFMLVNADKMYKAGLFDEHTFLYCEEMILAERFLTHGWHFYYDDSVSIIHEGGSTISKYSDTEKQLQIKFTSRLYYYKQYIRISFWQRIFAVLAFYCGFALHILKVKIGKKCLENKHK